MKKFEIHLSDWYRILFGQAPAIFLVEVFIRTFIVYIFLLFVLRWLGKRMSGQLTILEMAVMLTLGAIVSVSMQVPDRGIALSMFVLVCTLFFQRGLSWLGIKSAKVEELTQGRISTLVKDGILDLEEMKRCRISRQQLFVQLRSKGIFTLGEVRRVYLEACGLFSTVKMNPPEPGLPILPPEDEHILNLLHQEKDLVCTSCGQVCLQQSRQDCCSLCGEQTWTYAVTSMIK